VALSRADAVGNIAVIAAAVAVVATRINIPDSCHRWAMAAFFFVSGWRDCVPAVRCRTQRADLMTRQTPSNAFSNAAVRQPLADGAVLCRIGRRRSWCCWSCSCTTSSSRCPEIATLDEAKVILWVLTLVDLSLAANLHRDGDLRRL
jgi:hypothetical protein